MNLNDNVGTAVGVRNEEATLALKNSYPSEGQGHRLILDRELAATREDNHRQAELEETVPKICATAHTGKRDLRRQVSIPLAEPLQRKMPSRPHANTDILSFSSNPLDEDSE